MPEPGQSESSRDVIGGTINYLQRPRFYLCTPYPRMNSSHAMKSCVLILLVALLCAEKGEMENERWAGGSSGDLKGTSELWVHLHFHCVPSA